MTDSEYDHLKIAEPPWIELLSTLQLDDLRSYYKHLKDTAVFEVNGKNCESENALMYEFAKVMQFPDYFGSNWDAYNECINDLDDWINEQNYLLVVENAECMLREYEREYKILISILKDAGMDWATPVTTGEWQRPARTFHTVLVTPADMISTRNWGI